jgi:hypothetical protein
MLFGMFDAAPKPSIANIGGLGHLQRDGHVGYVCVLLLRRKRLRSGHRRLGHLERHEIWTCMFDAAASVFDQDIGELGHLTSATTMDGMF